MDSPIIYVVSTPIGHLDDLTPRARRILETVDVIAAEDTRVTRKLLSHLGIHGKKLIPYHDHNETERALQLVQDLKARGLSLALVSDAGTPCIADPGYRLISLAKGLGIPVHPVPGPSALTALVSASGLASDRLLFVGFLPTRPAAMEAEFRGWQHAVNKGQGISVVFFEATRRLHRTLTLLATVHPKAEVAIGRELTKMFEEIVTMPLTEALTWTEAHGSLKGEATVMVYLPAAAEEEVLLSPDNLRTRLAQDFQGGATLKDLLRKYQDAGLKRAELYQLLLEVKSALPGLEL